jgi:integrase
MAEHARKRLPEGAEVAGESGTPSPADLISADSSLRVRQLRRSRTRKRADGEGTISQHTTSGMWRGRLMIGRKPDGRPDVREVYAKTQAECRRRLDELKRLAGGGTLQASTERDSVAGYLEKWLEGKRGAIRARTHLRYGQLLRKHIVPALGRTKLNDLKPDSLQRLYGAKLESGLAPRTVHHIHTVLHTALQQAVQWGYVPRNVTAVVSPPSVPHKELRWPRAEEVRQLLVAAESDRLRALWALAAHTGMRQGELLGLAWDAVDLSAGELYVRRNLVKVKAQEPTFGEPKSKRSRRTVPLTEDAVLALRDHRTRQGEERLALGPDYAPLGLVFATQIGTPLAGRVVQMSFKRALKRAGLPGEIRFHDLRHAAASTMLANGVDVASVAVILGHSRTSTTLDVYAHVVPKNLSSAVGAIQRALRSAS